VVRRVGLGDFYVCFPAQEDHISLGKTRPRARLTGESRLVVLDHPVDDAVRLGLLGAHEVVALGVLGDLLQRLAGVLGDDLAIPTQIVCTSGFMYCIVS
jgi:hypothetical protein